MNIRIALSGCEWRGADFGAIATSWIREKSTNESLDAGELITIIALAVSS